MMRGTRSSLPATARRTDKLATLSPAVAAVAGRGGRGGAEAVHRGAVSFSIQAKRDTLPAVLEVRGRFSEPVPGISSRC